MVHFSILNRFCLPLLSFFFSLRSVCPPTQQMAKVKHMSVLRKWRRCQSSYIGHDVTSSPGSADVIYHQQPKKSKKIFLISRFFLSSTMHFTLCATGSACVYPAHTELKVSRFRSGRWRREGRSEENKNIFEMGALFRPHKERFYLKLFMRVAARKDDTHHRVSGPV